MGLFRTLRGEIGRACRPSQIYVAGRVGGHCRNLVQAGPIEIRGEREDWIDDQRAAHIVGTHAEADIRKLIFEDVSGARWRQVIRGVGVQHTGGPRSNLPLTAA